MAEILQDSKYDTFYKATIILKSEVYVKMWTIYFYFESIIFCNQKVKIMNCVLNNKIVTQLLLFTVYLMYINIQEAS